MKTTIAAMAVVLLGFAVPAASLQPAELSANSLYRVPMTWSNAEGKRISLSAFSGKPVVITMAYTTCRYSCPLIFAKLKDIQRRLKEPDAVQFVVVSLKPAEDIPERLKTFQSEQTDLGSWYFLTGNAADTRKLSLLLGINFQKDPGSEEVMHSNVIQLLDAKGEIAATLTGLEADISSLVEAVQQLPENRN